MTIDRLANDDLPWLAEQYVLGELGEVEADAFEKRLVVEQSAREAVASAVELLGLLRHSGATMLSVNQELPTELSPTASSRTTGTWGYRAAGILGVAASLAVAAFLVRQSSHSEREPAVTLASSLAGAWSETQEAVRVEGEEDHFAMGESHGVALEEVEAPDWLLTAVSLRAERSQDAESSPPKPVAGEGA